MVDKLHFAEWLKAGAKAGSGKVSSYLTALDDADGIAQHFNEKFKIPSVYEMPDECLESLHSFIASEERAENGIMVAVSFILLRLYMG